MATKKINGMVFPPVMPSRKRGGRNTNQLEFMRNVLFKSVWKHKNAWPFHAPVDTVNLNLPDYHEIIKTPMDLGTIEKRLKNFYYNEVSECIYDFTTLFVNCYVYNDANDMVVKVAKELEKWFLVKLAEMPKEEKQLYIKQTNSKQRSDDDEEEDEEEVDMDDVVSWHFEKLASKKLPQAKQ